jgi:hypothetical protein
MQKGPISKWNRPEPSAKFFRSERRVTAADHRPSPHIRVSISALPSHSNPRRFFTRASACQSMALKLQPTTTKCEDLYPTGLKSRNVIALTSIIDPAGPGAVREIFSRSVGPAQIILTKNKKQVKIDENKPKPTRTHREYTGDIIRGMVHHPPMQRCNHATIQRPLADIG